MGFGWDPKRDPCDDAVRAAAGQLRVALREVRSALRVQRGTLRVQRGAAGSGPGAAPAGGNAHADPAVAVHEARKALRRCRALAELLRPLAAGDRASDLIASLRGARRRLSDVRDDAVLRAALRAAWRERLGPSGGREDRAPGAALAPLRARLEATGEQPSALLEPAMFATMTAELESARHDLKLLHAAAKGVGGDLEPLARGLRRMHRRARSAAAAAAAAGGRDPVAHDVALHDARKRFKELGYVMRWWAPAWRGPIEAWLAEADALSDLIGADHDQVVLRSRLAALGDAVDGELLAQVVAGSERRSARLRAKAGRSLTRLAAEPSDAFVARHLAYMVAARALRAPRAGA